MKRRSKYNNKKVTHFGITFDSIKEGRRYLDLRLLEKAGQIFDLELQPKFPIEINGVKICTYKADFRYKTEHGEVVEDVKGYKTAIYNLKKKLVKAVYDVNIFET